MRSQLQDLESVEAVCSFVVPGEDLGLIYGRQTSVSPRDDPSARELYVDGFQIRQEQDHVQRCIAQCRRAAAGSLLRRGLVRLHRRIPDTDSRLPSGGRGIDHPHWHDTSRNSPIKSSTPADGDRGRPSGVSYLP